MSDRIECVVVGGGVVGLAVAQRLARGGREVLVLESEDLIGSGISSRNSEVIHAGIYYPAGSRKAELCVEGKQRLYRWCESHGVPHRRCGKLIVATAADELATLDGLKAKAAANGVDDLTELTAAQAQALEPELACTGALLSPSTGIIDSHALMLSYQGELEDHGGTIAFLSRLEAVNLDGDRGHRLEVALADGTRFELEADILINAAGLGAQGLARRMAGLDPDQVPPLHYCKGSYFSLASGAPFSRLIYPVPKSASLGVHVTVDMGGQVKFGPDQEWVERIDYDVDIARSESFYEAIRRYWPALRDGALQPAYAGMRPKIQAPDEPAADFLLSGPESHGHAGLVNLFGIESPGLTASLAIAERVAEMTATD